MFTFTRDYKRKSTAALLTLAIVVSSLGSAFPTKFAQAQGSVPVNDMKANQTLFSIQKGIASIAKDATVQTQNDLKMTLKEYILDVAVFAAINAIIEQAGNAMVEWINSGFEKGGPGFMTDPKGFALSAANVVSADLIKSIGAEYLCDNFTLPSLKLSLDFRYKINNRGRRAIGCSLTGIAGGLDKTSKQFDPNFISWTDWASVSTGPGNGYASQYDAEVLIDKRIATLMGIDEKKLDWGSGFPGQVDVNGFISTPGKVVEAQINSSLGSGSRRIEVADEISEILNALVGLVLGKLTGGGGLNGNAAPTTFTNYGSNFTDPINMGNLDTSYNTLGITPGIPLPPVAPPTNELAAAQPPRIFIPQGNALQGPLTYSEPAPSVGGSPKGYPADKDIDFQTSGSEFSTMSAAVCIKGAVGIPACTGAYLPWWEGTFSTDEWITRVRVYERNTGDQWYMFQKTNLELRTAAGALITADGSGNPIQCTRQWTDRGNVVNTAPGCTIDTPVVNNLTNYVDFIIVPPIRAAKIKLQRYAWVGTPVSGFGTYSFFELAEVIPFRRPAPVFTALPTVTLKVGDPFDALAGVTAVDADGTNLIGITVGSFVDPNGNAAAAFDSSVAGLWEMKYNVSDKYGIPALTVTRTVNIE